MDALNPRSVQAAVKVPPKGDLEITGRRVEIIAGLRVQSHWAHKNVQQTLASVEIVKVLRFWMY